MNPTSQKLIRGVCIYDIVSTIGMAVPGVSVLTIGLYASLHQSLGLGGQFPDFTPMHHMFVNCTGVLAFVWSIARMRSLDVFMVKCDIGARFFLSAVILYSTFAAGTSQIFLAFVATETIGAVLEIVALKKAAA